MIEAYRKYINGDVGEKLAVNNLSPVAKKKNYQENPFWELWQGVQKSRPFTPSDSEKKYFIRDK